MKLAVLSESPADEEAILILAEAILGCRVDLARSPVLRTRGWQSVLISAETTLRFLHYSSDADGLIVTLDSDESPVHHPGHAEGHSEAARCRLCQLQAAIDRVQATLRPRQGRGPIRTAIGLAVPAIEAWYLVGADPHVTEAAWPRELQRSKLPYTKRSVKQRVYGTDRPSLVLEMQRATQAVRRLVEEGKLPQLESLFPNGFGLMANTLRQWKTL